MAKKNKDVTNWRNDKKDIFGFLGDNKKILMPAILVVAVAITIVIALGANKRTVVNVQTNTAETEASVFEIPQQEMELNAYPEVNALVEKYYEASANGDSDTLSSIYKGLDDTEILKAVAASEYIEKFENIDVYTKPGPVQGSYVAYVYNEVKLYEYDGDVPGLETLYICTDDSGNLYINGDIADINELDYLKQINVQADVIDLNNKVATSYNEMVSADEKLAELLTRMRSGLQVSVGEALATSEAAAPKESSEGSSDDGADDDTVVVSRVIKATDVINIRSSDSETADILDRTTKGQEFTEIEALANGWSKIQFKDTEAYVKTEFFDVVSEERVAASDVSGNTEESAAVEDQNSEETSAEAASSASSTEDATNETSSEASSAASEASSSEETGKAVSSLAKGKMVVTDSVKLRKGQGTDTDAVTTIYAGESVNVVEQYANGWAKVEYKNKTGYIKSEYLRQ
jgi:uncharacterized protein YgiM (DUF1202 family)